MGINLESKKFNSTRFEERKCLVCFNLFYCTKRKCNSGRTAVFLRSRNSKTCSKKCSRLFMKDRNVILQNRNV